MSSFSIPTPLSATFPIQGNAKPEVVRNSAIFPLSIWGDRFLEYHYDQMTIDDIGTRVEELKHQVQQMLKAASFTKPSLQLMNLIDTLQRLGLSYHFEEEIEEAIEKVFNGNNYYASDDLYTIALHFRLLRVQGYNVSSDVFHKYKDENGNFKGSLRKDPRGMLCLYEAVHLRVQGEEILDEALAFTTSTLTSMVNHLGSPLVEEVGHALKRPLRKGIPRLEARHYISIYEEDDNHDKLLLEFAKLDFNLVQSLHLKELSEVSKWWKDLDFALKLPYARNRLIEGFFWSVGIYFEPHYSSARVIFTKIIAITSLVDDTYDAYGTLEELSLFTDAVQRWDIRTIDELPEYMKLIYHVLLEVYHVTQDDIGREGKLYCVDYAKEAMKDLVKAYLIEAKWFNDGYIPTMEEYMDNASISTCNPMLMLSSFIGMGDIVPREAEDWVMNDVIPIRASFVVIRLMDDIVSHEFEQERGHVASAVECYMKQYVVSEEEACNEFKKRVDEAWKALNKGCLKPTVVPQPLLARIVNFTRMPDVVYKEQDGYTLSHLVLKDFISSLFINQIHI